MTARRRRAWYASAALAAALTLALSVALAIAAALMFAGNERVARATIAVLERSIPGLHLEGFTGTLIRGRLRSAAFDSDNSVYEVQALEWQVDPSCLPRFAICIERLAADLIKVRWDRGGG
ncbi:MAG: hypothetical protein ACO3P1_03540, partial [Pseudomonadales bacterium]